jgi:hypothetical protein
MGISIKRGREEERGKRGGEGGKKGREEEKGKRKQQQHMGELGAFLFVCLLFSRQVSLCSPGCPGTHSVDQAGLELRNLPASASQVWGFFCSTYRGVGLDKAIHLSGFSLSFVNKLPVLIPYLRGRQAETGKPNSAGTWENTALFTFLSG